ncbi:MAG: ATP-dependent Clp protease adapter ClpS [Mariprofundales bacterium]|nr:ATP-dependent Clp protease adapter ClpS [Mariprofundales bacterium]
MAIEIQHQREAVTERLKPPPLFKVILLNDDYTPMDFVANILMQLFHKGCEEAEKIVLQIHQNGQGICGVYVHDIAETKQYQVMSTSREQGHPLKCIIETDR